MGLDPLTLGLTAGGISAATSLFNSLHEGSQKKAHGIAQQTQANQLREQARTQAMTGRQELAAMDKQRAQLRRDYNSLQSANAVNLGTGNVDLSSGSALDVALGNADRFASDINDNAYNKALKDWEIKEQSRSLNAQANLLDSQGSYAKRTAFNLLPTLLGAGLSGASGFMTGYQWGGMFPKKK